MVELPLDIGLVVRDSINKYRRKNNIPEPEELRKVYNKQTTFLESELQYVTELIINGSTIEYLDYFPNLKSITIDGLNELKQTEIQEVINKYPNLEKLSIISQDDLRVLNVSSLSKLQDLSIVSNKHLKRIIGIENIDNLYSIVFYNNQTYTDKSIKELCEYIYETVYNKGTECNIDVLYMTDMLKYLSDNNKSILMIKDNLKWSEQLKYGIQKDHLEYKTGELQVAYKKALNVVNKYIQPTDTPEQKYAILYQWMCENVKYDYEALDNNHTHTVDGIVQGRESGTNGTINGLVYGSCVCQGYSKAMQMLLKLSDIYSSDISCIAEDAKKERKTYSIDGSRAVEPSDHSILKVNLDGKIFYSDITWDAARFQNNRERKYFLLSKRDISSDHKLIGEDEVIDYGKSVSISEQEELLKYASERIKTVDKNIEFKKDENSMQGEYTYTQDDLLQTYKNAEINQNDLNNAYETINRTKQEREQDKMQNQNSTNNFEGR